MRSMAVFSAGMAKASQPIGWCTFAPIARLLQKNHTRMNSRDGHDLGRDQAMVAL